MTKSPSPYQPLPAFDFTIELFCRVDDTLLGEPKRILAHLHPSEVVTLGLLYALRGQGYRAFYRWVQKELGTLFPRLPEQSRLFRLLRQYHGLCQRFMAQTTAFGVCDTLGIELLHPRLRCERAGASGIWRAKAKAITAGLSEPSSSFCSTSGARS